MQKRINGKKRKRINRKTNWIPRIILEEVVATSGGRLVAMVGAEWNA